MAAQNSKMLPLSLHDDQLCALKIMSFSWGVFGVLLYFLTKKCLNCSSERFQLGQDNSFAATVGVGMNFKFFSTNQPANKIFKNHLIFAEFTEFEMKYDKHMFD